MSSSIVRVLMLGDSIGKTGRALFARHAATIKQQHALDVIIINGENSADNGKGITPDITEFFLSHGADVVTTGNHIWDQKEIIPYLSIQPLLLRPANMPNTCPGTGLAFVTVNNHTIAVINAMGRVFMDPILDCPFKKVQELVAQARTVTPLIFVDFHAQATAEKIGFGYFLDGTVTAVVGTHTHTQTNDARVLPAGTGYITDLGMIGSLYSVLGFDPSGCIIKLTTGMPHTLQVPTQPPYIMSGLIITADTASGKALTVEPFRLIDHEPLEGIAA